MTKRELDGDVDLLQAVVEAFLEEYPTLLAELETALHASNCSVVQRASHTIRGTLRLFGNVPAKELAERLEMMGASGSLENAMGTNEALKQSMASLRQELLDAMKNVVGE
jgi:HPt (histidine-containing phosphotransfer) domain-containing protein